jgi:hypothetical protein
LFDKVGKLLKVNSTINAVKFISSKKTQQVYLAVGYYLITDIVINGGEIAFIEVLFEGTTVLFNRPWFNNIEIL